MKKFLSKKLKSEKGFTLVELLAVIVILAILAAIAIPVIANLIGNSRSDAQDATAQQMIEAARLAQAQGQNKNDFTLGELITGGYLSEPSNPQGNGDYNETESKVTFANGQYKAILKVGSETVGEAGAEADGSDDGEE